MIALLDINVNAERLFGMAYDFTWEEVRPSNKNLPQPPMNELRDMSNVVPSQRAKELLGSVFGQDDWTGLEASLEAGITSLGL